MHIWEINRWENVFRNYRTRKGLRLRFDTEVDPEVKRACKEYINWLKSSYDFPIKVRFYFRSSETIRAADGELVSAIFTMPIDYKHDPYIRIATGDYQDLKKGRGQDNALAAILNSITHELTHYFQWINGIELTARGYEQQAIYYARGIVYEYLLTCEHP